MNAEEIKKVVEAHCQWLKDPSTGTGAYLRGAYLRGAYLRGADLTGADLTGADLTGADLTGADLTGAKNLDPDTITKLQIVPSEGAFIGWKKVEGDVILKLEIQSDAQRVGGLLGRKCRTSTVKVLEAFGGEDPARPLRSKHDPSFCYKIGEVAESKFDPDPMNECTSGIHFFLTRLEAEEY